MEQQGLGRQIINFFFFSLLQILIVKDLDLFNTGFCFAYIGFLLLYPLESSRTLGLLAAFAFGLFIDIFFNTYGINAAACVLIMFIRPRLFELFFSSQTGSEDVNYPDLKNMGTQNFSLYILVFAFIHHLVIFYGEAFSTNDFFYTFWKATLSAFFTTFIIVISQFLFFYTKSSR